MKLKVLILLLFSTILFAQTKLDKTVNRNTAQTVQFTISGNYSSDDIYLTAKRTINDTSRIIDHECDSIAYNSVGNTSTLFFDLLPSETQNINYDILIYDVKTENSSSDRSLLVYGNLKINRTARVDSDNGPSAATSILVLNPSELTDSTFIFVDNDSIKDKSINQTKDLLAGEADESWTDEQWRLARKGDISDSVASLKERIEILEYVTGIKSLANDYDILLPDTIYMVVGTEYSIYLDNIGIDVDTSRLTSVNYGSVDNGLWTYTPSTVGNRSLTFTFDYSNVTTTVMSISDSSELNTDLNFLAIGDSRTYGGYWLYKLKDYAKDHITPIGLVSGYGGLKNEGHSGKTYSWFESNNSSPFIRAGSDNLFLTATSTNGYYVNWNDGTLVANANYNTSDYIAVLPDRQYSVSTPFHYAFYNSSHIFVSGQTGYTSPITIPSSGVAYIRVDVGIAYYNSFNFSLVGDENIDFTSYIEDNTLDTPDAVIIRLGTNDIFSTSSESLTSTIASSLDAADSIITSIHEQNNNILIGICLETPPPNDSLWNITYSSYDRDFYKYKIHELNKSVIEKYGKNGSDKKNYVSIIPIYLNSDKDNDFYSNGVHETIPDGYYKNALFMWGWLRSKAE